MTPARRRTRRVTPALLRRMALPSLRRDDDKESRGRVVVVGGSVRVPGAVLLAGVAALRAGAGKLQMATVRQAAVGLALAVPESLVVPLPQTRAGEIAGRAAASLLRDYAGHAGALLIGPGMTSLPSARALLTGLLAHLGDDTTLLIDGEAIVALRDTWSALAALGGRVVLTPHAGEMASLLDLDKRDVEAEPAGVALRAAAGSALWSP